MSNFKVRINQFIRATELRVIGNDGTNYGILPLSEAIAKAKEFGLDLIEISPNATPPIAKITDYGKFLYDEKKKQKNAKAKTKIVEVKSLQVKVGTDENDLELKAKKASEWLAEGNRVKLNLFLPGRTKYMQQSFLKERLERLLKLITVPHKVAEAPQKSLKGMTMVIEKA